MSIPRDCAHISSTSNSQHCWILHLRPFAYPVALRVAGNCFAKFKTCQTLSHGQTDATTLNIVGLTLL